MKKIGIIGNGLAGSILVHKAVKAGFDVVWFSSPDIKSASSVAYGILNPVHIRNVVLSWNAELFYPAAEHFYHEISNLSGMNFYRKEMLFHVLKDENEAILWRQNVESGSVGKYSDGDIYYFQQQDILQPYGCVKIFPSLYVDVPRLLETILLLKAENLEIKNEKFDDSDLINSKQNRWNYKGESFDALIFCKGVQEKDSGFFKAIPFNICKGELLTIQAPLLKVNHIFHKKIFLIPVGDNHFRAGSTFEWDDLSSEPSYKGKKELMDALNKMIQSGYQIIEHKAGLRPAIADRRPVIGEHPKFKNIYIFNGLGSRGLILAPKLADFLIENISLGKEIPNEINVNRFKKRLLNDSL